ncbi:hypothetical protein B0H13DRAFT_2134306 [Mycena leptocephala]|nr:hypothetical protein B0H13DRAFT_2134306 [Mycena leptocephala]
MGKPRHTGTAQKKAFAATQDECVKKLVQVTAGALTNEALQLLFVSVQRSNLDLCAFYTIKSWLLSLPISSEEIVVQYCLSFFPHVWGTNPAGWIGKRRRESILSCALINTMTSTVTSILKRHLIFERFHAVQLGAAICMCAQQIFFDGSAKKRTFTSAFERAVAVFSKQASASGFLDEIEPWVDQHKGDFRNLKSGDDPDLKKAEEVATNMAQEVADMMKKYHPLIFGEAKG